MSAIWGIVKLNRNAVVPENAFEKMKRSYESRCKIDRYSKLDFEDGFFACGVQFITPQAHGEELPCSNGNGMFFTADCMIDNPHGDMPDGRFLYEKYMEKGPDSLKEIYGAYSVAVWDSVGHKLFLCADPAASRCLYYYKRDGLIAFSTLIDPIRTIFPDIAVNENYIKDFLVAPYLIPNLIAEESAYAGVNKIIQGEYKVFSSDKTESVRYFDPAVYNREMKVKTMEQADSTFRSLYEECVGDLLRNEVTGVAMSSGLDSSSIAVLAANKLKRTGKGRLLAYTYVPAMSVKSPKGFVTDETDAVKMIVENNPLIEPHFLNNNGKNCVGQIPEVVSLTEMPIKAVVNFPNLLELYYTAASDGCRVVLNGQMGNISVSNGKPDDIFYDLYKKHRYITLIGWIYRLCKGTGAVFTKSCPGFFRGFKEDRKHEKKPKKIWDTELYNPFVKASIYSGYPAGERLTKAGYDNADYIPMDEETYRKTLMGHPSFAYIGEIETKMGLQNGIIIRDPTRDARMLSFCLKLPYKYFAYRGTPRCLIRRNLKEMIPARILRNWRRYGEQNADWLLRVKRDKEDVVKNILHSLSSDLKKEYIDYSKIREALEKIKAGEIPDESDMNCVLFVFAAQSFLNL